MPPNDSAQLEAIVARIDRGDPDAWVELYDALATPVHDFMWRLDRSRSAQAVEDWLQEVFLTAWRRFGSYDRGRSVRGWIFGIARNTVLNGRKKRSEDLSADGDVDGPMPEPEHGVERLDVQATLDRLTDAERELVLLRREGFTVPEIAEILGVGEAAAKARLYRACDRFRELYQGGTP